MAKKVVRVHFVDKSCKAVAIDANTTAQDLRYMVIEKIGLKEDACFALFEKRDEWERCLEPDEKPVDVMAGWDKEKDKKKSAEENMFVFKKKIFLNDDDREMEDPAAKDLIYKQAQASVISSEYPCTVDDAIRLASLQFQIVYGDHNAQFHVPKFLIPSLKDFVPKTLYSIKRPQEWESLILSAHEGLVGKDPEDAKSEYLNIVKQWAYYGTTFYPPCKSVGNKLPSKYVIIGINYEGIRLLKKNKDLISEHLFTEICSWASSAGTFAFEFGNQNESQKYTFETKQGAIIASTIQTYIDILVQMLKNGEDDDDESESTATQSSDG